jgi:hypothetical protein
MKGREGSQDMKMGHVDLCGECIRGTRRYNTALTVFREHESGTPDETTPLPRERGEYELRYPASVKGELYAYRPGRGPVALRQPASTPTIGTDYCMLEDYSFKSIPPSTLYGRKHKTNYDTQ